MFRINCMLIMLQLSSVQSLSCVWLFATPWIAACQASLSITNTWSLPKLIVHQVGDAIQPSHPLLSPSPPAPNPPQHQGLSKFKVLSLLDWGKLYSKKGPFIKIALDVLMPSRYINFPSFPYYHSSLHSEPLDLLFSSAKYDSCIKI